MSHAVECAVYFFALGSTVFFGKMKCIIIILERINHKKHLFGVEAIKADLPKYAKNQ